MHLQLHVSRLVNSHSKICLAKFFSKVKMDVSQKIILVKVSHSATVFTGYTLSLQLQHTQCHYSYSIQNITIQLASQLHSVTIATAYTVSLQLQCIQYHYIASQLHSVTIAIVCTLSVEIYTVSLVYTCICPVSPVNCTCTIVYISSPWNIHSVKLLQLQCTQMQCHYTMYVVIKIVTQSVTIQCTLSSYSECMATQCHYTMYSVIKQQQQCTRRQCTMYSVIKY